VWKGWIRLKKTLATLGKELPPAELLPPKRKKQSPDKNKEGRKQSHPTHSIIYVPLLVCVLHKNIFLIVQYIHLKSCSKDFKLQDLILRKSMRYWFYFSTLLSR